LSLGRGILVVIGGAFERLFCPEGRNLNKPIFKSSNARGVARGGGKLNFRIDRRIICPQFLVFAVKLANILMFTVFGENTV